jgi:hypothetical protein
MSIIALADIHPGDIIKATVVSDGVLMERSGKVWSAGSDGLRTEEDGWLYNRGYAGKYVFDLIDRPKQTLPTEIGSLIIAEMPIETIPLRLGLDGQWWYLSSDSYYHANSVKNRPWKLAKLVDA